jgi:hypothetical protein
MSESEPETKPHTPLFTRIPARKRPEYVPPKRPPDAAQRAQPEPRREPVRVLIALVVWGALVVLLYFGAVGFDWTQLGFSRSMPPEPAPPRITDMLEEESAEGLPQEKVPPSAELESDG